MDEQLEQPIERREAEAQSEEAVLSPAGEEAAKEAAERTDNPETEVKTESSAEEKVTPDAELSASEEKDNPDGDDSCPPCLKGDVSEADRGIPPRNYYAEWQELAEAHPEVVGKELPEDIYQACMQSELPPLRVYESMMLQKQAEQISALQQEIATLRQNAENTARAPVLAAAGGPDSEPEDLFLKGFNSY